MARINGSRSRVRPPKMMASIGTPLGFSKSLAILGTLVSEVVKRLFGCAHGFGLVGLSAIGDQLTGPVPPAGKVNGRARRPSFPPHVAGVLVVGDVREQHLGAGRDRAEGSGVGHLVGVLGDTEDTELRIDRVDPAVLGVDAQPGDVVAVELDVIAVTEAVRRQHHGQVRLAGRAREPAADVPGAPGLLVGDADEHELLG